MRSSETPGIVLVTGTDTVPPEACALIEEQGFELRYKPAKKLDRDQLHRALDGVSGYLIGGNEEPLAEHFDQAGKLQAVAWVGTDFRANVPGWEQAFDLGIAFVSTPGANAISVAEFTLLLILAVARPIATRMGVEETGNDAEAGTQDRSVPGIELHGRTLGIVGAGRIGARVAKAAALGLGMKVLYTAPRRNEALEAALGSSTSSWRTSSRDRRHLAAPAGPCPRGAAHARAGELERIAPIPCWSIPRIPASLIPLHCCGPLNSAVFARPSTGWGPRTPGPGSSPWGPDRFLYAPDMATAPVTPTRGQGCARHEQCAMCCSGETRTR